MDTLPLVLSIDWGETFGYSLVNEFGTALLCGSCSCEEASKILPIFAGIDNLIIVAEHDPTGKNKFINIMITVLSKFYDVNKIVYISPATWKYSKYAKVKPYITQHAVDSFRQSYYYLGEKR